MEINGRFITFTYEWITYIYDFLVSVFTFFLNNTASSAFKELGELFEGAFGNPVVGSLTAGFVELVGEIIGLLGGDEVPLIVFVLTAGLEIAIVVKVIKLFVKWL